MFDDDTLALAAAALDRARATNAMLLTVESCTGGLLAGALTAIPGSSDAVEGGVVTYSNEAKARLGVDPALIAAHGAVSEAVARAMAIAGAASVPGRTAALSITGVAGPGGGTAQKPVGLVHFGLALPDGALLHREERYGDRSREDIRLASVTTALRLITDGLR